MSKKIFLLVAVCILVSGCSSGPAHQPWEEGRWNIYGLFDPDQGVRINHFYDDYDPETMMYKTEDLFWYLYIEGSNESADEFLEAEVVYLGETQNGIEFCIPGDLKELHTFNPSRSIVMRVPSIQNFTRNLDKLSVLKIKYRYIYRPVYNPQNKKPSKITNRRVSQAKEMGLMGISEFFLDEYEIIGKVTVPQTQIKDGLQRAGDILSAGLHWAGGVLSALGRGADRAIGKLLGIDDYIGEGEITLENGNTYEKTGMGEIVKKSNEYDGPDLYITSRVQFIGDRGNDTWAFREAEGQLVQTMKYSGHIPSNMKDVRIYYRLCSGGIFEIDEVKPASIFNDQW